jgi:hypothetical protein
MSMSNHGHLHAHSAEETSPSSLNMLQQQILTLHARGTVASLVSSLRLLESVTLESMVTFNRLGLWRHFLFRWALRSCEHSPSALDDQAIAKNIVEADLEQIAKDVHRTTNWLQNMPGIDALAPEQEDRRLELLRRVLTAFAARWAVRARARGLVVDGAVRGAYLQGMNGICYALLQVRATNC